MLPDDDIILFLFYAIAVALAGKDRKHSQGKLYLSEVVLCGVLFALKGISFRRFHKWLVNFYWYLCEALLGDKNVLRNTGQFRDRDHPSHTERKKL